MKLRIACPLINCITCHARLRSLMWAKASVSLTRTPYLIDRRLIKGIAATCESRDSCEIDTALTREHVRDRYPQLEDSSPVKSTPFRNTRGAVQRNSFVRTKRIDRARTKAGPRFFTRRIILSNLRIGNERLVRRVFSIFELYLISRCKS